MIGEVLAMAFVFVVGCGMIYHGLTAGLRAEQSAVRERIARRLEEFRRGSP